MKTIVAGSRKLVDDHFVWEAIKESGFEITELVCGMAKGVDESGFAWARNNGVPVKGFFPDWEGLGKRAGFVRNEDMAKYADALILVWDGMSSGSKSMLHLAKAHDLKIFTKLWTKT